MKLTRKRLYEVIEIADEADRASRAYDIIMMFTILLSLAPLCIKTENAATGIIELFTLIIFVIDYICRLLTADLKFPQRGTSAFVVYPFTFMALVDLISILPSFGFFNQGLRILKVFRLVRTFKVLKALKFLRYSRSVDIIVGVVKAQKEPLLTVAGLAIGYILISALVIFNVEPESFESFFDAVYWACVSLTTVGYGDIYPVSVAGRIVTMISSIMGIAIVALPSGIITAGYLDKLSASRTTDSDETKK